MILYDYILRVRDRSEKPAGLRDQGFSSNSSLSFLLVGSTLLIMSCSNLEANKPEARAAFSIPRIAQAMDSISTDSLVHMNYLDAARIRYWGKFRFAGSLDLDAERDSFPREDHIRSGPYYSRIDPSIGTDGLQITSDYSSTILINDGYSGDGPKYPVFLYNETTRPKVLWGKDSRVFALQEAVDSSGQWRPIEGAPNFSDGFGQWGEVIRPGQFVVFGMTKYAGNYQTALRIRLINGSTAYVSQPVRAYINYDQFRLESGSYYSELMARDPHTTILRSFYWSVPLEYKPTEAE